MDRKSLLVFGLGELQRSIIRKARQRGLFTIGIDPCADALSKSEVDVFEVVGGQDFEKTMEVAEKYRVSAIVTAAADKPLVMMARVAGAMGLPFFSVETAQWSTDKYRMKRRFLECGIPCAKGRLVARAEDAEGLSYPLVVKPRDNSGSRGVKFCRTKAELQASLQEVFAFSKMDTLLVEECIEGQEYSIEGLHFDGKSEVIQFTEKQTTAHPYAVELAHRQPALLTPAQQEAVRTLVARVADCLHFEHCASHTELKINERGIFIIETSPRLGGDHITSDLVTLSTGIDMEEQLLHMVLGEPVELPTGRLERASGVLYFSLPEGMVKRIDPKIRAVPSWPGVHGFALKLKEGDRVQPVTNSLNRYGEVILSATSREELEERMAACEAFVRSAITIEP